MILKEIECKGLRFNIRPGSSDEKTVKEVIERGVYERKTFKIEPGEHWLDLGGNIGAFACLAASRGAFVTVYEPDPVNVELARMNLVANEFQVKVKTRAVVSDDTPAVTLNLWPDGQSWRNSIVRNKRGTTPMTVMCDNFFKIAGPESCVKMDIEGAEIAILETWPEDFKVKKLVFEYSFDVDKSCLRLRKILDKMKRCFKTVKHSSQIDKIESWDFFPPCTLVHCSNVEVIS